jgi:hypothetical protein
MLHYIQVRLSAPATIQSAQKSRLLHGFDDLGVGVLLNLHCGHNNPFSKEERNSLKLLLDRAASNQSEVV